MRIALIPESGPDAGYTLQVHPSTGALVRDLAAHALEMADRQPDFSLLTYDGRTALQTVVMLADRSGQPVEADALLLTIKADERGQPVVYWRVHVGDVWLQSEHVPVAALDNGGYDNGDGYARADSAQSLLPVRRSPTDITHLPPLQLPLRLPPLDWAAPNGEWEEEDEIDGAAEVLATVGKRKPRTKATHPGITRLPDGAWHDWPVERLVDHFVAQARKQGKPAMARAVLNIWRWNQRRNPLLSQKARKVMNRLEADPRWAGIAPTPRDKQYKVYHEQIKPALKGAQERRRSAGSRAPTTGGRMDTSGCGCTAMSDTYDAYGNEGNVGGYLGSVDPYGPWGPTGFSPEGDYYRRGNRRPATTGFRPRRVYVIPRAEAARAGREIAAHNQTDPLRSPMWSAHADPIQEFAEFIEGYGVSAVSARGEDPIRLVVDDRPERFERFLSAYQVQHRVEDAQSTSIPQALMHGVGARRGRPGRAVGAGRPGRAVGARYRFSHKDHDGYVYIDTRTGEEVVSDLPPGVLHDSEG